MAEKGFAFAFVEGALVKAVREGWWLLLDEINLAPAEVCLLLPSVAFCCPLLYTICLSLLLSSDLSDLSDCLPSISTHVHVGIWSFVNTSSNV